MEEQIYLVCVSLKCGEITVNEATDKLLLLFKKDEKCDCKSQKQSDWIRGWCSICNKKK